ncbi:hypothetical protein SETIT_2G309500v2 [Setaria italica]|uniref:Alkyl transferase n=1 Tax=Setaria italica TaxID=4555 RepID=K4A3E3_SETIT|nr:uncharacterized protein LOC101780870 [Setaria italica]RCV12971.1 hypothetical protein SETIT_2G309500v2 [Setaria italica]
MNAPMLRTHSPPAAAWHRPAPSPAIVSRRARIPLPRARPAAAAATETRTTAAAGTVEALLLLRESGLRAESLPRHVGVVIDGHERWARARGLSVSEGHAAGRRAVERTVRLSRAWGIRALTVFVCSHENMTRPKAEIDFLMRLYEGFIRDNVDEFSREGIRLHLIGDSPGRPASLLSAASEAHEATRSNSEMVLMLAIGYSGRRDMVQACRELAAEAQRNQLQPEDIDEALIAERLGTSVAAGGELSCPDLVIRTSGERRLSNFLLWQSAFSELFFPDVMWPDFGEDEYLGALRSYQSRERRFGQRK